MNRLVVTIAGLAVIVASASAAPARAEEGGSFAEFLADRRIDREQRKVLEAAGPWNDARQKELIRVLSRLNAPAALEVPWQLAAATVTAAPAVEDRLVRVEGRATFVASLELSEEQALLAGRNRYEIVRIAAPGFVVDVVVPAAPRAWARWKAIDEPAFVVGLPVSTGSFPVPAAPPADGSAWPDAPPAAVLAASGVGWRPPTPLGGLGMDYGLFDTVVDGWKLEAGDTAAFYAALAAVGRAAAGAIEAAAGPPAAILPIIDPAQKWFASHRGDPVTVQGNARRVTRVSIDDPWRRQQVGADHYWELYVFVETPLLDVNGRVQSDYPIVCCLRTLPDGFPRGDSVSERVVVSGFAIKRYGYPLPDLDISSSQGDEQTRGQRMETALLVGRTAVWKPAPSVATATNTLSWAFATLAAIVGLALVYGLWSMNRSSGSRAELPDRIDLPGGRD